MGPSPPAPLAPLASVISDSADNPKAIVASTSQGTRFWGARTRVVTPTAYGPRPAATSSPGLIWDATTG